MSKSTYFTGQPVYSQVIKWYCPKNLHTFSDKTKTTRCLQQNDTSFATKQHVVLKK